MSKNHHHTWDEGNIVDDVPFQEKDAETFKELLANAATSENEGGPAMITGSILKGRIVEITKDHVVVDVGLKSEGLVPIQEFSDPSQVYLDAEVEVLLDQPEDQRGQIVLSREKAERLRQWEYIVTNCEEGSIVNGKVLRKVKGGLIVDIGMEAFLPGSQIDNKRIKNLDDYIGHTYQFKIIKINVARKNVVLSRRELLQAEQVAKKAEFFEHIQPGDVREGVVKNITPFGVFLDLDGIDGLLHITDMAWTRIKHPSDMVQIGQSLQVMILHVDKEKGRVALGLKQTQPNPWDQIEQKYPIGTKVHGKIVNLLPYGAFIEIEPGIEGLIHVSEMSWVENITDPSQVVKKGEEVEAIVLAIQKEEGKISLGIKQTMNNPWDDIENKYQPNQMIRAKVRTLTHCGAFVELEPGIEGFIHISDLSWVKKISHPVELLKKGDTVDAVVLLVDKESKKITLGIKQLSENPWDSIEEHLRPGDTVSGVVTNIPAFGVFVRLDNGIEGLIYINELSDKPFNKPEDLLKIGDEVTARVLEIDRERKRIALSLKELDNEQNSYEHDDIVVTPKDKKSKGRKKEDTEQDWDH